MFDFQAYLDLFGTIILTDYIVLRLLSIFQGQPDGQIWSSSNIK